MRKISKEIAESFYKGFSKSKGNTATDGVNVWLHGNKIAWRTQDNNLEVTLAGWPTVTTRERLNSILNVFGWDHYIQQIDGQQYLVNEASDSKHIMSEDKFISFRKVEQSEDLK